MRTYDAIIVGGGVAGLSAAVALTTRGKRVLLVERRQHLGGRTYSFRDDTTADIVDNGQHLMMGCYRQTLAYLRQIGSDGLVTLQPRLHIPFADVSNGQRSLLRSGFLPAPLHVLTGLLRLTSLPLKDRVALVRVGIELLWTAPWKEYALSEMTVDHWLTGLGQSEIARKHLWDVIAIGSLNDNPGVVAALPFFRVLRAAFFGKRSNASLLIPTAGLSEILVDPARRYIEGHGGDVVTGMAADAVSISGRTVKGVQLSSGEEVSAPAVIVAAPHYAAADILHDKDMTQPLSQLETAPIITVNLWFDREVMTEPMIALLNGRMQWVFNRSSMVGSASSGQYLSCIISGARYHVEREKSELIAQAIEDLTPVLPKIAEARLVHTLVIKEVRATFSPRPGTDALRPGTSTAYPGLFLAGDWTKTGLPATIEGAIVSGNNASEAAFRFLTS